MYAFYLLIFYFFIPEVPHYYMHQVPHYYMHRATACMECGDLKQAAKDYAQVLELNEEGYM